MAACLRGRRAAARNSEGVDWTRGIDLQATVRFYGIDRAMFGSEPGLVSLGYNVTAGVQFIVHGGGTLISRTGVPARLMRDIDEFRDRKRARSLGYRYLPVDEKSAVQELRGAGTEATLIRQIYWVPGQGGARRVNV